MEPQRTRSKEQQGEGAKKARTMKINSATELKVYKAAYLLAMDIFNVSKTWPTEEKFSLIDQIDVMK